MSGPLQNPSNTGANGTVKVEWQTFTAGDGSLIVAGSRVTTVSSGTYSQTFEPTSDASPSGVTYKVTYTFGSASPSVCYWSIPAGSGTVLIANVQTCSPPSAPAGQIALSQLSIGGGSNGQCAIISAGVWAPNSCTQNWTVNGNDIYSNNTGSVGINGATGTINAGAKFFVKGGGTELQSASGSQSALFFANNNLNRFAWFSETDGDTLKLGRYNVSGVGLFVDAPMSISRTSGNIGFGTGSGGLVDGGFQVDIQKSGGSGTFRVYDQTAITGVTQMVLTAGAGQGSTLIFDAGGKGRFANLNISGLGGSGSKYVCVDNSGNLSVGSTC